MEGGGGRGVEARSNSCFLNSFIIFIIITGFFPLN